MFVHFAIPVAASFLMLVAPAFSETAIKRANNEFGIGLIGTNIDYLETSGSTPLDGEKGNLAGLYLSGSAMLNYSGIENFYAFGNLKAEGLTTTYTGAYWGGTYGDLVQDDGALIAGQDFRFGKGLEFGPNLMLTPYVGFGAREWGRAITGAGGYNELYSYGYGGVGAMLQISLMSRLVLSAHGMLGHTVLSHMASTYANGGAAINPQQYSLSDSMLVMGGIDADYALSDDMHITAGIEYLNFSYGQSPASAIDGTYEPDSKTTEYTAKLGLGYSF